MTSLTSWAELNQQYLQTAIAHVRQQLKQDPTLFEPVAFSPEAPPALVTLCRMFRLSEYERDLLVLCAGMEFDGEWATLCATVQNDAQKPYPTLSLALATLADPHWSALAPDSPLRYWHLIEIGAGNALTQSPIRIDERILHYLIGLPQQDERLAGCITPVASDAIALVESHQRIVKQSYQSWIQFAQKQSLKQLPVIQLCGQDRISLQAIALAIAARSQLNLFEIAIDTLPTDIAQFHLLMRLCEREYLLSQAAFWIDCTLESDLNSTQASLLSRLIDQLAAPVIVATSDRRRQRQRRYLSFDVDLPSPAEQRSLWHQHLPNLTNQLAPLVSQFNLSPDAIETACLQVQSLPITSSDELASNLWQTCREQARPRLDELAQRISSSMGWEDLVLPDKEQQTLHELIAHVKQRSRVYETWGFGSKSARGLGITALFSGASGTGKTTAAEVIAHELQLDLYRIDLSTIVSKYIGETEKNLRRIFDAAEAGGVVLLFDEADSLFGKRSEVKDSRDRYANLEVSYLLQRMESYRGLAILTTNLKASIDPAFLRRIRFVVPFSFPDQQQRTEIWRRVFPKDTPTENLDFDKLARLGVAGGNIRNIAVNAAFIAADADEAVQMKHILAAARNEYVKLERPLTDAETRGWV
ncbi:MULTISPECIES: ATP-binding protein [Leptolyngbya]|nr:MULTISPECIES: ATP-binding protein [Leptolyngbya]MBD2367300.1 ATP-binding protein [Leptolyngbya sp. FACHB-161]MBD2373825.1 ATP-binding protein [Leptolyngbya sp. FACHB-238]MBD2398376.1 ATP-binding protein [Leptolyngbya sp. FACHB-239]MBD2404127.1 ATP-binding protein [Leptolyngbya sp. FACHB-402]ULP28961.1 ATP-binding protein [Leptolyngbya boryana IU 594]